MKIKVYRRNPRAEEAFQFAKRHHRALVMDLPPASKRPEPPTWKGFVAEDMDAATVEHIQIQVVDRLRDHPLGDGYILAKENIWVFERQEQNDKGYQSTRTDPRVTSLGNVGGDNDLKRVVDGDDVLEGATYYAFEVFDIVPCDLYKNVPNFRSSESTFCRPERRNKTKLAPLALAPMPSIEPSFSWTKTGEDGEPLVFGIPLYSKKASRLFCSDESLPITDSKWNPTTTAAPRVGVEYAMSLEKYETLVNSIGHEEDFFAKDPTAGILQHKNPLCDKKEWWVPYGYDVEQEPLQRYSWSDTFRTVFEGVVDISSPLALLAGKEETLLKEIFSFVVPHQSKKVFQELLFCFTLMRGTNLRQHGMALVVDNSCSENETQCSLVCTNDEKPDYWEPGFTFDVPPRTRDEKFMEVLKDDAVLARYLAPTKPNQPEAVYCHDSRYIAFPLVAAEFQLSQMVVRGWAEPTPPHGLDMTEVDSDSESSTDISQEQFFSNGDHSRDKMRLYKAMRALFDEIRSLFRDRGHIFRAIQSLESEGYHAAAIERRQREVLVANMNEELGNYHNGEPHGYELERVFYPAIEILEEVDNENEEE